MNLFICNCFSIYNLNVITIDRDIVKNFTHLHIVSGGIQAQRIEFHLPPLTADPTRMWVVMIGSGILYRLVLTWWKAK